MKTTRLALIAVLALIVGAAAALRAGLIGPGAGRGAEDAGRAAAGDVRPGPAGAGLERLPEPGGPGTAAVAGGAASLVPTRPPGEAVARLIADLEGALAAGDRAALLAASRALRDALLADPDLVPAAAYVLLDAGAQRAVREALAVVLGSLPGAAGKRAVLEGLRAGALAGFERAAILALGIGEAEDGDALERDDQPYAVEAAPGLVTFVRGPVADADARAELARRTGAADPAERLAAARALHDSTAFEEAREALAERVVAERDAEVVAEAASALGEWTRRAPLDDLERRQVVERLLDAAPRSDEVVRFRLVAPLSSTPLRSEERERLHALAAGGADPETRRFAVDVLGRRLPPDRPGDDPALAVLVEAIVKDPSGEVREAAALALGRAATTDVRAQSALANALGRDADWEVRAAAARSLGRARGSAAARSALEAALAGDPHPTVRAVAEKALAALGASPARPGR